MVLSIRVHELLTQNSKNNLIQNDFKSLIPKNDIPDKKQVYHKNMLEISEKTIELFNKIKSNNFDIVIYLKEHPRFEECLTTDMLYDYDFVRHAHDNLNDCLNLCTLHITEYSTVIFDSLIAGIPTILTGFCNELDIYEKEYHFPSEKMSIIEKIKKIQDDIFYKKMISKQLKWSKRLYEPFNEKYFIEVIG